jgi:hypothetical protein
MKQKKVQLKLLENGIFGVNTSASPKLNVSDPSNLNQDSESSPDEDYSDQMDQNTITNSRVESSHTSANNNTDQKPPLSSFKNANNLSVLLNRLKYNSESGSGVDGLNVEKLAPILKKLPKLNQRLELTFENMKSAPSEMSSARLETSNLKREIQMIDEKWRKYLETSHLQTSADLASKINFFQNISNHKTDVRKILIYIPLTFH